MLKNPIQKDIVAFLDKYYNFERVETPKAGYLALRGYISVIDDKKKFWGKFDVLILINELAYPNTIPIVIEKSEIINRDWDFHISKEGECCLDIHHKLIKSRNRGIVFEAFYREVIYPFFANYYFKKATGSYANGEYNHFFAGIAQYYKEEYGLENLEHIVALLETEVFSTKHEPNKKCSLCGGLKYKKCCRKIIYQLRSYGKIQLEKDLELFKKELQINI